MYLCSKNNKKPHQRRSSELGAIAAPQRQWGSPAAPGCGVALRASSGSRASLSYWPSHAACMKICRVVPAYVAYLARETNAIASILIFHLNSGSHSFKVLKDEKPGTSCHCLSFLLNESQRNIFPQVANAALGCAWHWLSSLRKEIPLKFH